MRLLTQQDRTEKDLRSKLKAAGFSEDPVEETITWLKEQHFLDDARYAEVYALCVGERRSRRRVVEDLVHRGVDRELAEHVVETSYGGDEEALIAATLQKRHFDPAQADEKERLRTYRFLLNRGFSPEASRHAIS